LNLVDKCWDQHCESDPGGLETRCLAREAHPPSFWVYLLWFVGDPEGREARWATERRPAAVTDAMPRLPSSLGTASTAISGFAQRTDCLRLMLVPTSQAARRLPSRRTPKRCLQASASPPRCQSADHQPGGGGSWQHQQIGSWMGSHQPASPALVAEAHCARCEDPRMGVGAQIR